MIVLNFKHLQKPNVINLISCSLKTSLKAYFQGGYINIFYNTKATTSSLELPE